MSHIKVLGSGGTKTKTEGTTSFLVAKNIAIDAGNILDSLGVEALKVEHIFLTHTHFDHIVDIPLLLDSCYERRTKPLKVYASKKSIETLKQHIFNNLVWPDFTAIPLSGKKEPSLQFVPIDKGEEIIIDETTIKPFVADHIDGAFGYIISQAGTSYLISGDTHTGCDLSSVLDADPNIKALFIECSFPNRLNEIARKSKHLSPHYLNELLSTLKRDDLMIYLYHIKHPYLEEIKEDLRSHKRDYTITHDGYVIDLLSSSISHDLSESDILRRAMDINLQLSSSLDKDQLYEMILTLIRELTKSDGGTLYIMSEDRKYLDFKVVQNETLGIFLGGKGEQISWNSLPLYNEDGSQNKSMVAVVSALENRIINIEDAYTTSEYNFEGTRKFDASTGYRSKSMLVVPLVNHEGDVIGVLQLLNKEIKRSECVYTNEDEQIIKALSAQAAMALTNTQLITSLEQFLYAFTDSIASAIDAKSAYTSTHIKKISILSSLIAEALHYDDGRYADVVYSDNDFKQIDLAAKLHDIGKISIPEAVMDKANKLSKVCDRIEHIILKTEILKRDYLIEFLEQKCTKDEYKRRTTEICNELDFVKKSNMGGEFMRDEDILHLENIAKRHLFIEGKRCAFLDKDELYNLSIRKGTLTNEERSIINSHATLSCDMLSALPFPKKYSKVMNIAINHHEKLNGKGYPRGLSADDLSLEDRILILADVFEALTSNDRPYKGIKKLSEVFKILDFMVKDGEIDGELLEFFKNSNALKIYSKNHLLADQRDV
ncbi:MAG: HD domain-containing phosphohydrolase [Sulfuricurvum sp.]